MMGPNLVAKVSTTVNAPRERVWEALVNPVAIQQYMFGTHLVTDWQEGSSILWKGEWQGKAYEDKGVILHIEPGRMMQYSHFSPFSGVPDRPENYHVVTVELSGEGNQTRVTLTQDNNPSEQDRTHSEENWGTMLAALKRFVEQ